MPDEKKYLGWTDANNGQIAGMQDYWLVSEGPEIIVDGTGVITVTAGFHNIDGSGTITNINGAQRNGQFVIFRIGDTANISFGSGGNVRATAGDRIRQRWFMLAYRNGYWEDQSIPFGDFASGVLSWKGRTGEVVPLSGDYSATLVTASDPTGSGGTNVQTVLNNLKDAIDAVTPGAMVTSFNARTNVVVPVSGDYTGSLVTMTPFTVSSTTIPGPSVQEALQQIVAAIGGVAPGGVTSWKTRVGAVVPVLGDYTATLITATDPTGYGGTQAQAVMNNLYSKISVLEGLVGGGSGITSIQTPARTFNSASTGSGGTWPAMVLTAQDIRSDFAYSALVGGNMGLSNDLPAGTVYSQLVALASRDATKMKYDGTGGLNADIRTAPSVGEALNRIPGGIVTAQGANAFVNYNTFDLWTRFDGEVIFNGPVTGLPTIETQTTTRSVAENASPGYIVTCPFPSAPAGTGWVAISSMVNTLLGTPKSSAWANLSGAFAKNIDTVTGVVTVGCAAVWIRMV